MVQFNHLHCTDCVDNTTVTVYGVVLGTVTYLLSRGIDALLSPLITDLGGWILVCIVSLISILSVVAIG
jgi:hypothetical protein